MLTVDDYYLCGHRITVRANGTAYITFGPCNYREFRTENAARKWAEDHMKWCAR